MSTWVCLRDEYVPLEVWAGVEHASDCTHVFDCDLGAKLGAKPSATSPPHWGMQGGSKYRKACSLFNNSFYLLQSTMQKYRVVVIASDAISRAGLCISPDPNYRTGFALSSKRMQAEAMSGVDSSWNLVRVESKWRKRGETTNDRQGMRRGGGGYWLITLEYRSLPRGPFRG